MSDNTFENSFSSQGNIPTLGYTDTPKRSFFWLWIGLSLILVIIIIGLLILLTSSNSKNIEGLLAASKNCEIYSLDHSVTQIIEEDMSATAKIKLEIRGKEQDKCLFYMQIKDLSLNNLDELSQEEVAPLNLALDMTKDFNVTCKYTPVELEEIILKIKDNFDLEDIMTANEECEFGGGGNINNIPQTLDEQSDRELTDSIQDTEFMMDQASICIDNYVSATSCNSDDLGTSVNVTIDRLISGTNIENIAISMESSQGTISSERINSETLTKPGDSFVHLSSNNKDMRRVTIAVSYSVNGISQTCLSPAVNCI